MSAVLLASGGLDSTLAARLGQEIGLKLHPLFVDYGQRARERELSACEASMQRLGLPAPRVADLAGFGALIRSGLTDSSKHIVNEAFTPGRNTLFLLAAASYAVTVDADSIIIGLLHEGSSLFPDQTSEFLRRAEQLLELSVGRHITVLAPLAGFYKRDVVLLACEKSITGTYSCHEGGETPCGRCIACMEFKFEE